MSDDDAQQGDAAMGLDAPLEADGSSPQPPTDDQPGSAPDGGAWVEQAAGPAPQAAPPRRSSRFIADLTRAMHAAAEETRASTLEQYRAEAKTVVESIHSRSADDATAIRRSADEDVTGVREWSKAEIARIREETDRRIADRKSLLDRELEGHAAVVEREIEIVQEQVASFEGEMDGFFAGLVSEDDPSRFAALAASFPEPPPFHGIDPAEREAIVARALAPAPEPEPEVEVAPEPEPAMLPAPEGAAEAESAMPGPDGAAWVPGDGAVAHEGAAEAAPAGESMPEALQGAAVAVAEAPTDEADPRLALMGGLATADGDLAEAEAAALADVREGDVVEASLTEDSIVARLAGLTPGGMRPAAQPAAEEGADVPAASSQVVVTGLTSVASIAAFKRQLGRLEGVRSVAVSSGPSGEFVFSVTHDAGASLADLVTTLSGFDPQVTRAADGVVELTAHDPEA